jgi:RNA polymerase sigma-70 factor (ECF subfamily)
VRDDIVSETFLIAFRTRRRFDMSKTSALPWLMGIATNVLSRHRKSQAVHWRGLELAHGHHADSPEDEIARSVGRLDAESQVERLYPRIAALSKKEREVLFLHAWGDLTYEQIATALHIPVGTVRSRLSRIRAKLAAPPPTPRTGHTRPLVSPHDHLFERKEILDGYL